MMKYRWAIPASLGALCFILAAASIVLSSRTNVKESESVYEIEKPQTFSSIALEEGQKYALEMAVMNGMPVGQSSAVSAVLLRDDVPVFEVEDAYWHERGVWREGGETGTWDEQNISTTFTFAVPESGSYDLEVTLLSASGFGEKLGMRIVRVKDFPLSAWPLLLGGLFLFGIGGAAHLNARGTMGRYLETMGPGSRLRIKGVEYTVEERTEEFEGYTRTGMEFRLRSADGLSRWLAVDRYEREHPYLEDEDQLVTHMLFEIALHPGALQSLNSVNDGEEWVVLGDEQYQYDRENSGIGSVASVRNGDTFRSDYHAYCYRQGGRFPMNPGDRWLILTRWRDSNEAEWSLMEIVDWTTIEVLEHVPGEAVSLDELRRTRGPNPAAPAPAVVDYFTPPPARTASVSPIETDWDPLQMRASRPRSSAEGEPPSATADDEQAESTQANGHYLKPVDRDGEG